MPDPPPEHGPIGRGVGEVAHAAHLERVLARRPVESRRLVQCHETVRDAEFVHRGEDLVVQRVEVFLRATGRERQVGE